MSKESTACALCLGTGSMTTSRGFTFKCENCNGTGIFPNPQNIVKSGEGSEFIEWCKKERLNFSNGMQSDFNWYELKAKQRVIVENLLNCFDQLLDRQSPPKIDKYSAENYERHIAELEQKIVEATELGYNLAKSEAEATIENLSSRVIELEGEVQSVNDVIFTVIRSVMQGMMDWYESDNTFIVDKSTGEIIDNCELSGNINVKPTDYIYPLLKKEGIHIIPNQ